MRFREFIKESQVEVVRDLQDLEVAAKQDPKKEPAIKTALSKLLQFVRSKVATTGQPVEEDIGVKSISQLSAELKLLFGKVDPKTQKLIQAQLDKIHQTAFELGKAEAEKSTQQYFSDLETVINPLLIKVSSDESIQQQVKSQLEGWFSNTVLRDRAVPKDKMIEFLREAGQGHIIDMKKLVQQDQGNVHNFINPKYKDLFEMFKERLFKLKPGGSGANLGPGEVAFTLLGNPAEKAAIGDIKVDGVMYEIKGGSKNKGGRMNGKLVQKPTAGFMWIDQFFKKNLPSINPVFVGDNNKKAMKYNWNPSGIRTLNQDIANAIPNKAKRNKFLMSFLDGLWKYMIRNHEDIADLDTMIANMLDTSTGEIDPVKAMRNATHILYESYILSDGEMNPKTKKSNLNIIVLNTSTLNYQIIRTPKDLDKVAIKDGISWNNANSSASPQVYIS